ncbi:MAG: hypothetical protein UU64_C0008G0016 [candidate division WWE3 bacterium GW2011_GWF2_41_45]|uniref:Type 4 fimbrial biogenesis protein PilX N-terminal domain-containing protein n=3 Tax=Katanobacteria TaxID=422282 RepID=A0A1F4W279_UNCKA|nr:MAG: hypothetical protein UU55_C0003G0016 [candidate division WWE3 bacterium GW2011_GWC2_41_23]KKS10148.1 MAG: hypothetical protein UU64_C0008G0016 [candidate division WWE3 bacterium GW2011_GWF2_41_45]KKS19927.1 MAG: hypothetical protein UU79_C0007G0016 [candidate division WWE3 bacterium GW2011_GWE1_41_72]KKS28243.1 MAG: hypothetical protein UU86_C0007G0015 [candidate division WWE3 bacterium GW2011_GWC1_42_102]KKS28989.1 MAG: hypothetical protein UU90_C0014G0002 [candidate division WWE3 bact
MSGQKTYSKTNILKNNEGQALLFVVVALTISTVIGVSVATRTLSVTKRVAQTDTQTKVYYAAEAGIERFVNLSTPDLKALAAVGGNTADNCAKAKAVTAPNNFCSFTLGSTTTVETSTLVKVQEITYNETSPSPHYSVKSKNGIFSSVSLSGYTGNQVTICWKDKAVEHTAVYYTLWGPTNFISKAVINPTSIAGGDPLSFTTTNALDAVTSGNSIYSSCHTVLTPIASNPYFLNVMPLGGDATIGIFPGTQPIPPQGFLITSKASLNTTSTLQQQVVKVIEATRTYNHVPGFYDAALYVQDDIIAP